MPTFNSLELAQLKAGLPRFGLFFRLDADQVIRLWLGVGKIRPGTNALDASANVEYKGFGEIAELPAFLSNTDGSADRVTFSFSGIPPAVFAQIAPHVGAQQILIQGKPCAAGYAIMGKRWELLGVIRWQWDGFADFLALRQPTSDSPDQPETWTLELSCGDAWTGRRRAGRSYWSDQDQQSRYPGDRGCERTVLLTGTQKVWPPR